MPDSVSGFYKIRASDSSDCCEFGQTSNSVVGVYWQEGFKAALWLYPRVLESELLMLRARFWSKKFGTNSSFSRFSEAKSPAWALDGFPQGKSYDKRPVANGSHGCVQNVPQPGATGLLVHKAIDFLTHNFEAFLFITLMIAVFFSKFQHPLCHQQVASIP